MTEQVDDRRLLQLQACIESAARSLRLGLGNHAAGDYAGAVRWYERGSSSLSFAGALAEYLRARRCRPPARSS